MGEVYRARDTRLNRDVALKVLRAESTLNADRLQRFVREAQSLAALNHPHIAQIYGLEDAAHSTTSGQALVMELVEGEDLSDRISREAIPVDEAIPIARQIAEALEAAHDVGIIHRDLKPANVKVRADGAVKVLDFGLAKAFDRTGVKGSSGGPANSPTITSPAVLTSAGMILGTAAYMSPEQARGKTVDKRADIWAFGVVLYEMLTGYRAFRGDTVTDVMAAVVTREPDWSALPPEVPASIRHILRRCLEKDHALRLRDIGEARVALASPAAADAFTHGGAAAVAPRRTIAGRVLPWAIAGLAIVSGASAWLLKPAPRAPLRKLELSLPADGRAFTLSPDGTDIAYFARGRLWTTNLQRLESRDLAPATLGSRNVLFWSPDSAFVGYNAADGRLWIVPRTGGTPLLVCTLPETRQLMGATWRRNGSIVLAVWRGSLYEVPASGGNPSALVTIDPAKEIDFHLPVELPDGRVLAATHLTPKPGAGTSDTYQLDIIDGPRRETVLGTGFFPIAYAEPGYLLAIRFDAVQGLWALRYPGRGRIRVEDGFLIAPGAGFPSVSRGETLLYSLASNAPQSRELVWVDRAGQVTGQIGSAQLDLASPALSPDGHRVAFSARVNDNVDIWVRDLRRNAESRLTFEAGEETLPAWFPSSRRIAYVESTGGVLGFRLAAREADGSGGRMELGSGMNPVVSPHGRYLVYHVDERGNNRLRYSTIAADGTLGPVTSLSKLVPEPNVVASSLAPDGNFVAYVERQASGNAELFVAKFPSGEGRWQISNGGGRAPRWAGNGELFFLAGATIGPKQMMGVPATLDGTRGPGTPVKLFEIPDELEANYQIPYFDVTGDGKRFVMIRRKGAAPPAARWVLVQNWLSEFASRR